MPALVVVGAQWGDEGKGKVVDLYTPYADLVVRYAGGANAGHTLVVKGEKLILHLIPSGILHDGQCVIAQGTVLDPEVLLREIDQLEARGVDCQSRLKISDRAHVVLPQHKLIDGLREAAKGDDAIGTTKRGIGPTYEDKVGRRGVRMGDLRSRERLQPKLEANLAAWRPVIEAHGGEVPELEPILQTYLAMGARLGDAICDTAQIVAEAVAQDQRILLEGAQGTMLDIDHGTYPFVTSSNAIAGGACAGAGIGPTAISAVVGITKAYATRVGGGPFPTELNDEVGQKLRDVGVEYGSTTGRPRRCGWMDAVALRLAVRVNGMTEIALTKLDVLRGHETLKICVAYELDGERLSVPPYDDLDRVTPVYESLPGFSEDISGCRVRADLPANARAYIERLEDLVGCKVGIISVGPDREATADVSNPFGA
ncbi:MAG: adenylosuccinate synthase [Myxococcales bacterium]|nr:adenylosuccinate synthase [Myxococcales bacterium]MCB9626637.1 adenylosuccinate synthase [Sandaracinaceae bacterium]